jgi:hypothetical protein
MSNRETSIRYEATDAEVVVAGDLTVIVFETVTHGRVGVQMPRSACERLSEQLQSALAQANDPSVQR